MNNIDDIYFLKKQFKKILDEKQFELPSEWIERTRYMTPDISRISGYYRFANSPFWKEPLDMLSPLNPIEKVVVEKGVQTGFTCGILENYMAYCIGCNPMPMLYITADEELLKTRFPIHLERLIDSCGLRDKIFSQDHGKTKKTGDTKVIKQYSGGYLWGIGSNNKNKMRSMPFPVIMMDELETFHDSDKEGSTESIAENRSNTFIGKRKIIYGSTPLIMQSSKIHPLYMSGDCRKFFVPCIHCGEYQVLEWHRIDDNGKTYGIIFEVDERFLPIYETVRYKCKFCDNTMTNEDKAIFMKDGQWRPTRKSDDPKLVSYHLSALYSMPGFYSWADIVSDWKDCWDLEKNKIKDRMKFQEFRNLKLGLPFIDTGEQISREKVSQFRNPKYLKNQINNNEFLQDSGSGILLLTAAVDVQKDNIFVHIMGWCIGGRNYTIDVISIDGPAEDYHSPVWKELDNIIVNKRWPSDNGNVYGIIETCIDSGKYSEYVYSFCKQYSQGVHAIKGDDWITGGLTYKEFSKKTLEKAGLPTGFIVNTTKNKDRIASMFNLQWNTGTLQPEWFVNFPFDMRDDIINQFESEQKIVEKDKYGKYLRSIWRAIPGRENHIFDTFDYNIVSLEIIADIICRERIGLTYLDWKQFWEFALREKCFYIEKK